MPVVVVRRDNSPRVTKPETTSVGIPGIAHAMRYAVTEMGVGRGARTLHAMNQADGFDCPGCAWPDPDATERSIAEFCENGAKADGLGGDDASASTRDFFAAHSVE